MYTKRIMQYFAKLPKQHIADASYEQLIDRIRRQYNYQEFKNPSALSLLEAHHQFRIFCEGDWVLDVGAGPMWTWTDLALKLTTNPENTNFVISNDTIDRISARERNTFIRGDFLEQPTLTKIAMNLLERQLNTILIDATGEYTGSPELDGRHTMDVVRKSLEFSMKYLKKGGNLVYRVADCNQSLSFQQKAKFLFHEVHRYKPTNIKFRSPIHFYVLKGFGMTPNQEGVRNFLRDYRGTPAKKVAVVEKYRKMYDWDPVTVIEAKMKERVSEMKQEGLSNRDIIKVFDNDPFVKIKDILRNFQIIEDPNAPILDKVIAKQKILTGRDAFPNQDKLPRTEEQFAEMILKEQQEIKKPKKSNKPSKEPLGDNEQYLKFQSESEQNPSEFQYSAEDFYGYVPQKPEDADLAKQVLEEELQKIKKSFPDAGKEEDDADSPMKKNKKKETLHERYLREREQWMKLTPEQQEQQKRKIHLEEEMRQAELQEKVNFLRTKKTPKVDREINQKRSRRKHREPF